jgi:putative transposase
MPNKKAGEPPSQTWRTFLDNHLGSLASVDFFAVPSATFCVLLVFFVLRHDRRRVVHFNMTEFPSAAWTAQQIIEAFPENTAPTHMIRDRDGIYGDHFRGRVGGMGIEEVLTAPRSPWQNGFCERVIGTLRRDCLDNVLVLDDRHAERILREYLRYYHGRPHRGLRMQAPIGARWLPPARPTPAGAVRSRPVLGGLHHEYGIAA